MNPDIPDALQAPWLEFLGQVERRLVAGARDYGDASLRAPVAALANEVEEELLDVMGWGFLLWLRMRGIADAVKSSAGSGRVSSSESKGGTQGHAVTRPTITGEPGASRSVTGSGDISPCRHTNTKAFAGQLGIGWKCYECGASQGLGAPKIKTFTFTGWDGSDRAVVKWTPESLDIFHNGQQADTSYSFDLDPASPKGEP